MRAEKKLISSEYLQRLNESPFFVAVDYRGLRVSHFNELRKRLAKACAEIHVVKNSIFRVAAREAGIADLGASLSGQMAVVTGQKEIAAVAKVLKTFTAEFDRPKIKFGYLDDQRLESAALLALADLPSLEVLRATLLGVLQAPASRLVRLIGTPAGQLARVIKGFADKAQPTG
jgi:large subunit ribosomal protein L10